MLDYAFDAGSWVINLGISEDSGQHVNVPLSPCFFLPELERNSMVGEIESKEIDCTGDITVDCIAAITPREDT